MTFILCLYSSKNVLAKNEFEKVCQRARKSIYEASGASEYTLKKIKQGQRRLVKIAILDTMTPNNPCIKNKFIRAPFGEYHPYQNGVYHGSTVLGPIDNLTDQAEIHYYSVFGKDGLSDGAAYSRAIKDAIAKGVDIINLSMNGGDYDEAEHRLLIEAKNKGVLIIHATTNDHKKVPTDFEKPLEVNPKLTKKRLQKKKMMYPQSLVMDNKINVSVDADGFSYGPGVHIKGDGEIISYNFVENQKHYKSYNLLKYTRGSSLVAPMITSAAAYIMQRDSHASPSYVKSIIRRFDQVHGRFHFDKFIKFYENNYIRQDLADY